MAQDETRRAAELDFIETLYGDPVRGTTSSAGRNLLVASLLLIAVMKFGAQVQSTALFPISFSKADVLPTVLAAIVALLMINFLGRALTDIGLFIEGERRIDRFTWDERVSAAVGAARGVDDSIDADHQSGYDDPEPWWEEVGKVRQAAEKAREAIEVRLGRSLAVRVVRHVRLFGEATVPVIFGIASLALSAPRWHWPA
jgi:hypothetical protein